GAVDADHRDWETGVGEQQEAGVPAAQDGVGHLVHTLSECAARADGDVPGSANAEVVACVEEATAPVGGAGIAVLPIGAFSTNKCAAAVETAVIGQRLTVRVGRDELQAATHTLAARELERMIVHGGG